KTSIFSHPVYLFLREFSLQDFRGGSETANPLVHVGTPTPLDRRVEDAERQIITEALNIHQGRINEVAEYLQIPRKKLYLRMKKYGLR
ncbi:helix-turn-helix domain-containing protein, partial [Escherichia coli]|uniref:helix-turn-helix domain-containing protein n=1 Tax=Escherichia coli TaxID=562 RepID=UPI0023795B0B